MVEGKELTMVALVIQYMMTDMEMYRTYPIRNLEWYALFFLSRLHA